MSATQSIHTSPAEFLARALGFGLLVICGIAGIVVAGAWWAACIAAAGMLLAIAGLVASVFALLEEEQAMFRWVTRRHALVLGTLSVAAILVGAFAA
jgi:hypothetical protein